MIFVCLFVLGRSVDLYCTSIDKKIFSLIKPVTKYPTTEYRSSFPSIRSRPYDTCINLPVCGYYPVSWVGRSVCVVAGYDHQQQQSTERERERAQREAKRCVYVCVPYDMFHYNIITPWIYTLCIVKHLRIDDPATTTDDLATTRVSWVVCRDWYETRKLLGCCNVQQSEPGM